MLYSKSTGGFYDDAIHGDNIPTDAVQISRDEYEALINGQATGKLIVSADDGRPLLQEPTLVQLISATLAKARALRGPIKSLLSEMQASATAKGTMIVVNGQSVRLDLAIEDCKQALMDLPTNVDLSQCTTQQQMELVVLQAYQAIVLAAPPEIKSAFDSLKP